MEKSLGPDVAVTEGFGWDVYHLAEYFYADDDILASNRATRLQWSFETLTKIFNQMGLCKNVAKTMIITCQTCRALGIHSVEACRLQVTGEGYTYQE